jgi:hypothetical protein
MTDTEQPHPDRCEHAKSPKHVDQDDLDRRTEHERVEIAEEQR